MNGELSPLKSDVESPDDDVDTPTPTEQQTIVVEEENLSCCGRCMANLGYLYDVLGISHLAPIILLVIYSIVGGYIFMVIEHPVEVADWEQLQNSLNKSIGSADFNRTCKAIEEVKNITPVTQIIYPETLQHEVSGFLQETLIFFSKLSAEEAKAQVSGRTTSLLEFIKISTRCDVSLRTDISSYTVDSPCDDTQASDDVELGGDPEYNWVLPGAIFFATTLFTTIGYGSFSPATDAGRGFAMIYALMGIPIVLIILTDIGKVLFKLLNYCWDRVHYLSYLICSISPCLRCCRPTTPNVRTWEEVSAQDCTSSVPFSGALLILVGWICGCAGLMLIVETKWTFFESVYFFFISLTTIGLGDYTPTTHRNALLSFPLVFIGLAVITMCINIIQSKLEELFQNIMMLIDEDYKAAAAQDGFQFGLGANPGAAKMGVNSIAKKTGWKQKVMLKMMDSGRLKRLEEHLEKKSKLKNQSTQTTVKTKTQDIQTLPMVVDLPPPPPPLPSRPQSTSPAADTKGKRSVPSLVSMDSVWFDAPDTPEMSRRGSSSDDPPTKTLLYKSKD